MDILVPLRDARLTHIFPFSLLDVDTCSKTPILKSTF